MIIGQTGDWHLEEKRLEEQVRCIEHMIDEGTKAGVELWLILGDIFGTKVPYHATELERLTFKRLLDRMCDKVILFGNHDAPLSLDLYEQDESEDDRACTWIVSQPQVIRRFNLNIVAFPYPSKRWVVGAEGAKGIEELRLDLGQRLFEILRGLLLSVETDECIIAGHCSVGGAYTGGGEILAGQEIELSKAQLTELFEIQPKLRYIGLGHIHQAQEIVPGAWYAGTPASQGFDGCNEHGFLLIDTASPRWLDVRFMPTPAQRHYTIDVEWQPQGPYGRTWFWGPHTVTPADAGHRDMKGARVKFRPRIPDTQRKAAAPYIERDVDELRAEGATVIVDPCVIPHARARAIAATVPPPKDFLSRGQAALREGLAALWQSQTPPPAMDVQARALAMLDE